MNSNIIPIIKRIGDYETRLENLTNWKKMFENYDKLLERKKNLTLELENIEKILDTCEPIVNSTIHINEIDNGEIDILMKSLISSNNTIVEKKKTWLILLLENMINAVIFFETRIVDVLKYLNTH